MAENQNNLSSERSQSSCNASNENRTTTQTEKILPDKSVEDHQRNASGLRIRIPTAEKGKQKAVNMYPVRNPSAENHPHGNPQAAKIGLRDTHVSSTTLGKKRLSLRSHPSEDASISSSSSRSNIQTAAAMYAVRIPTEGNYPYNNPQPASCALRDTQIANPTLGLERLSLRPHPSEDASSSSSSNNKKIEETANMYPVRIPTAGKYPYKNPQLANIGLRDSQVSKPTFEIERSSLRSHTSEGASSSSNSSSVQQEANIYPVQIPAAGNYPNYYPQLANIGLRDSQFSNPTLGTERLSLRSHLSEGVSGSTSSSSRSNSSNIRVPYNPFFYPEQFNFFRSHQGGSGVPIRSAHEGYNSHSFHLPNYPSSSTNLFNNNMNWFHNQIGYENVFRRDCCFAGSLERQYAKHTNSDLTLLSELSSVQIVELAKCPEGSNYLKGVLTDHSLLVANHIFTAVLSSEIVDFMNNECGKHVFQKLVENGDLHHMEKLVMKLANQQDALFCASMDTNGSTCVQKLIKIARRSNFLISIVLAALAPRMLVLMKDSTGRRVIQTCLENLNPGHHGVILEVAKQYCLDLALHANGCVSLNLCIENMREDHRRELAEIIIEHSICLSQDVYGNFVVQKVLDKHNPKVNMRIFEKLQDSYVEFSKKKFGSHVVERCVISGGIEYVIKDFLRSDALDSVAGDQFGNFVIQRLIEVTRGTDMHYLYKSLEGALLPHLPKLQFHPYGNFIYNLIIKGESSAKDFGTNRVRRDNFPTQYCTNIFSEKVF